MQSLFAHYNLKSLYTMFILIEAQYMSATAWVHI